MKLCPVVSAGLGALLAAGAGQFPGSAAVAGVLGRPELRVLRDDAGSVVVERHFGDPVSVLRRDVLEANLDEVLDVQALINADRRRRKDQRKQLREDRKAQPHGRVRPKPRREA